MIEQVSYICELTDPVTYEDSVPSAVTDSFNFKTSTCVLMGFDGSDWIAIPSVPIHYDLNVSTFYLNSFYVIVCVSMMVILLQAFSIGFHLFKR